MPQALTIVKSEPLAGAATPPPGGLSVVKSEPLQAAAQPPPGPQLPADKPATIRAATRGERFEDLTGLSLGAQQQIGGGLGAVAASAAFPEAGGVAPVLGAALGGGATAAAQGTAPSGILGTAAEQGALEVGGQAVAWPIKALTRRVLAHPVAQAAAKGLESARSAVNAQLDTVLGQAEAAVRGTREGVANAVGRAKDTARRAGTLVGLTEQSAAEEQAQAAARWPSTPPPPGATQATGKATAAAIQGPAQHSLDRLGSAVESAAQSGPAVDMAGVQNKLRQMSDKLRTTGEHEAAGTAGVQLGKAGDYSPEQTVAILQQLKSAGVELEASHPLPGVLGRIQAQPESVPFADAHTLKLALDNAVNWDSPARKQVQQITKGVRNELRTAMRGHAPYDQATAAYQAALPLFRTGYAKQIVRQATDNPEGFTTLIKGSQPTRTQMLKDVLTTHGGTEGQQAWDSVRSQWTYENLIKGGVENFDTKLGKLHPDFVQTLYGDPDGQQVLGNLKQISEAFQQTVGQSDTALSGAQARAQAATVSAQRTGEQGRIGVTARQREAGAVREQVRLAKQPTAEEQAFKASPLASTPPPEQVASDVLHVGAMHGMNVFRAKSAARLLLGGAKTDELVHWAAFSGPKTQALVQALKSPAPGMMLADLYRQYQMEGLQPPMAVSHTPTAPTSPSTVAATPPPGR